MLTITWGWATECLSSTNQPQQIIKSPRKLTSMISSTILHKIAINKILHYSTKDKSPTNLVSAPQSTTSTTTNSKNGHRPTPPHTAITSIIIIISLPTTTTTYC